MPRLVLSFFNESSQIVDSYKNHNILVFIGYLKITYVSYKKGLSIYLFPVLYQYDNIIDIIPIPKGHFSFTKTFHCILKVVVCNNPDRS